VKQLIAGLGLIVLSSSVMAKNSATKTSLTPREIFRKTASQWSGEIFVLPKKGNYMLEGKDFEPKRWHPSSIKGEPLAPHPLNMHGVAWDYDLRIPIVFYDPSGRWIRPGQYQELAVQQDIVPTLASILDIPPPAQRGGRVLRSALLNKSGKTSSGRPPKAIVVFIQDQMGRQFLEAHPGRAKFYEMLMAQGAHFTNGSVAHVDVETSVGHAGVGTGTWPSEHGVAGNNFFHKGIWRQLYAFTMQTGPESNARATNPGFFFTPTLSDVWSFTRKNKPVILSVAPAPRASIAMAGHGALFNGGAKTYVTWLDEFGSDGLWTTETSNYQMPRAFIGNGLMPWLKEIVDKNGKWRGHQLLHIGRKEDGLQFENRMAGTSPALVRQQSHMTLKAVEELKVGQDDETDLIWINMKATDNCGHAFGFESDECGDVLQAADEEAKKLVGLIEKQTAGEFLVVLTADHGAAPLPELSGAYRLDRTKLRSDLNREFDRRDNGMDVVQVITHSQVFVNEQELMASGFSMKDIAKYLRAYKAKMEFPYNARADYWLKKGKAQEATFFEDVVLKSELK
jgi:hypothetical protein